jgi:hypothetical protein
MSRSRKKTPVLGMTGCRSEKHDKRLCNRILRSWAKRIIDTCQDFDNLIIPTKREAMNIWSMGKDGKHYTRWRHTRNKWSNLGKGLVTWHEPYEGHLENLRKWMRK